MHSYEKVLLKLLLSYKRVGSGLAALGHHHRATDKIPALLTTGNPLTMAFIPPLPPTNKEFSYFGNYTPKLHHRKGYFELGDFGSGIPKKCTGAGNSLDSCVDCKLLATSLAIIFPNALWINID